MTMESRGVPSPSKGASKRANGVPAATCAAKRTDGKACHCAALPDDPYGMCFWHSPDRAGQRVKAQIAGGHTRQHAVGVRNAPTVHLESVDEVRQVLADVITKVRRGQLDPKSANSLRYLLALGLRAVELTNLDRRLRTLEAKARDAEETP